MTASDPDGDEIVQFHPVVKNGENIVASQPDHTISIDPNGTFIWDTPPATGDYTIEIRAEDSRGALSEPLSFHVTVISDPEGTSNESPIIDTFEYGTTATEDSPYEVHVPAHDPDGDPIVYSVTISPALPAGYVDPEINQAGKLTWSSPGPVDEYTLTVTVDDGITTPATADLNLSVQASPPNNPPQILNRTLPSPATEAAEYSAQIVTVDPDGDPVTQFALDAESVDKGMVINSSGLLTWTPTAADAGDHTITVTATDVRGGVSIPAAFLIRVQSLPQNNKPRITSSGSLGRATESVPFTSQVHAHDPDGDPLSISLESVSPDHGISVSVTSDGKVEWNTPANPGTTYTLTVAATDDRGLKSELVDLTIDVVAADAANTGPTISDFSYPSRAFVDSGYEMTVPASDPDGDPINYSIEVFDPSGVQLDNATHGIDIDNAGRFTWNTPDTAGSYTFVVTVSDQATSTSTDQLSLEVIDVPPNNAPVVHTEQSDLPASATLNAVFTLQLDASDPDGAEKGVRERKKVSDTFKAM